MDRVPVILSLILILTLVGYSSTATITPANITDGKGNTADKYSNISWGPLPSGSKYSADNTAHDGGLRPLYEMAKKFVNVVQPNSFPYTVINKALDGQTSEILNDPMKLVMYGIGFVVCFAIGILFIIIMPIVGCCFCCCRLCGNCGGKKIHNASDINNCHRISFTVLVFVMATFIMIPAACSLFANNTTSTTMENVGPVIVNNINDLGTFLNNTIVQLKHISLTNYLFAGTCIKRDLDNIGVILGGSVQDSLQSQKQFADAFNKIKALDVSLQDLAVTMNDADSKKTTFQTEANKLKTDLTTQKSAIDNTKKKNPCPSVSSCVDFDTSPLGIYADPANLDSISSELAKINDAKKKSLTTEWNKGLDKISQEVESKSATMRTDVKKSIDDFYGTISAGISKIDGLTSNLGQLDDAKETIKDISGQMKTYDKYRWYGGIALGCLLILIAALQYFGSVIGGLTYNSKTSPMQRSCLSNSAGLMLMSSVGFCFIFSWLLMLLTTLTFMLGGNMQKLICEPLLDPSYRIYKELIDKPDGPLGKGYFLGGMILQDDTVNLTVHGILDGCKNKGSAYNVLKLDNMFKLSEIIDYDSKMDIRKQLDSKNIDLSNVNIKNAALTDALNKFSDALKIDFTKMVNELSKKATNTRNGLTPYADALDTMANLPSMASPVSTRNEFKAQAAALRNIDATQVPKANSAKAALLAEIQKLQTQAPQVQADITAVDKALTDLNTYITTQASTVVSTEMATYVNRLLGIINSFVVKTLYAVKNEIGICTPLWNLYDSIIGTIVCKSIVDTLNGFWFSLGWATIFFIPAIIFSVKLNKYLRRCTAVGPDGGGTFAQGGKKQMRLGNLNHNYANRNKVAPGNYDGNW